MKGRLRQQDDFVDKLWARGGFPGNIA